VEALLVKSRWARSGIWRNLNYYNRFRSTKCFKLVGVIRSRWHGLSGGAEVWQRRWREFFHFTQNLVRSKRARRLKSRT